MPPFRIHQTRNKPERILIRLIQGKYILPQQIAPIAVPAQAQVPDAVSVPEKKKTTISLKQIKQILMLLQKSEHKNLSKLLSPEITSLLSMDEDQVDEVAEEEEEEEVEETEEEDEDDILIINV